MVPTSMKSTMTSTMNNAKIVDVSPDTEAVEVPMYEFIDVEVNRIVEIPERVEQVIIHEVPKLQYVEKVYKVKNEIEVTEDIKRRVPCPVELVTQIVFTLPMIRPSFEEIAIPLHVPRFIEVPMPADLLSPAVAMRCELIASKIQSLDKGGVSLCEIENIAATVRASNFDEVASLENMRQDLAIMHAWDRGTLLAKE